MSSLDLSPQGLMDPPLAAFEAAFRRHDLFYDYSDDVRSWNDGVAERRELVALGRVLPRADVMMVVERVVRKKYGDWRRHWHTDPVPTYLAAFEAAMDRTTR